MATYHGTRGGRRHSTAGGRRRDGRWRHTFAALDLGTNNCRLLVARPTRDGFHVIDSFSRVVRLGQGLAATGVLGDDAIARTIEALKVCAGKMRRRRVTLSRSVATEACRQAGNCHEFLTRVTEQTGIDLDIIDAAEEARLAVTGCAPLLDQGCENALVFDIGGGSTEVMWLRVCADTGPEVLAWTSLPCGVVSLAETHGGCHVPQGVYDEMVDAVADMLRPFEASNVLGESLAEGRAQMLGTSGTVTTLAAIKLGLPRYDRRRVDGTWLAAADLQRVSRTLATMSYDERSGHPCIGEDRADLVIAGCAIFDAIFRTWPAPGVRVADRGVRDGMLFGLMAAADTQDCSAGTGG
jgi:exopolyphosphatase/guanosine-5'-triphosphate,3'-diphosphate pyrophosphatase